MLYKRGTPSGRQPSDPWGFLALSSNGKTGDFESSDLGSTPSLASNLFKMWVSSSARHVPKEKIKKVSKSESLQIFICILNKFTFDYI